MQYSDLDAHIKTMMQPCAWATQLEIVALATYFQVPVYIFKESTGQWEHHKRGVAHSMKSRTLLVEIFGILTEILKSLPKSEI